MIIGVDKSQKEGKHDLKHSQLIEMGHELMFLPLPVGDYIIIDDAVEEVIKRRGDRLKKMDLIGVTKRSVDTKQDMNEVYGNFIGNKNKQHDRFRDETILAQQNRIELTVLVESAPDVSCLSDVQSWKNWKQIRAYCKRNRIQMGYGMMDRINEYVEHGGQKPPVPGEQLYKAMKTSARDHGYRWAFCRPEDTGKAIVYLLTKDRV